jgi:hypothetical protein
MPMLNNSPISVPCRNCTTHHPRGLRAPADCRLAEAEREYADADARFNRATTDAERDRAWKAREFLHGDIEIARRDVQRDAAYAMNRRREREGYRYGILLDD